MILDEINMHESESKKAPNLTLCFKNLFKEMVGVTGIEPVTPSMSTKCSPAELHPHTISVPISQNITLYWETIGWHVYRGK